MGKAVRMWTWTWTWTWTRVRAEWAEEGAGVEPTDTDRWGPGAHSDSEPGGRNMISKAIHGPKTPMCNATVDGSGQMRRSFLRPRDKCARVSLRLSVVAAASEWVPTRSRMTAQFEAEPHLAHGPR